MKFILLGILQGLTEFLPVSSDGHLVIAQSFLGIEKESVLGTTVMLHLGTTLAVITYFFKDLLELRNNRRWLGYILLVTVITGAIGLSFKEIFEKLFGSVTITAILLMINGCILILPKFVKNNNKEIKIKDSTFMALTQALAIAPGISRSGITITTLLLRGIKSTEAFKFSFISSIPIILGAALLEIKDVLAQTSSRPPGLLVGIITAYIFGLIALSLLSKAVSGGKFHYFGIYCLLAGSLLLLALIP